MFSRTVFPNACPIALPNASDSMGGGGAAVKPPGGHFRRCVLWAFRRKWCTWDVPGRWGNILRGGEWGTDVPLLPSPSAPVASTPLPGPAMLHSWSFPRQSVKMLRLLK